MLLVAVQGYTHTSIEDPVYHEKVYSLNRNNPVNTLILPHNSADIFEKSVWSDNLINLVEFFVESNIRLIFVKCYQDFDAEDALFFIGVDVEAEPCNDTSHGIFGPAGLFPRALY